MVGSTRGMGLLRWGLLGECGFYGGVAMVGSTWRMGLL